MKKVKRKYTRKETTISEASKSSGIQEESSIIPQVDTLQSPVEFSFDDLPLSLRTQVENTIKLRERFKLPDDSKDRKERAVRYFRGDRLR